MRFLIVSATNLEIAPLINYLKNNDSVEVLVTGIGMVATAFALGRKLSAGKYDYAINAGIAGCFNRSFKLGDVVNVTSDTIADFGAEDGDKFIPFRQLDIEKLSKPSLYEQVILNDTISQSQIINGLIKAKGISVNTITGKEETIKRYTSLYNPDVETMEGAAFMIACKYYNLPFTQIRAISNYVEQRNTANWNIPLAIQNLNNTLINIIND